NRAVPEPSPGRRTLSTRYRVISACLLRLSLSLGRSRLAQIGFGEVPVELRCTRSPDTEFAGPGSGKLAGGIVGEIDGSSFARPCNLFPDGRLVGPLYQQAALAQVAIQRLSSR